MDTKDIIKKAGGPAALARKLGDITSQAISQWQRIPADRCLAVSEIVDIPPQELRPDLGEIFQVPAPPQDAA